MKTTVKVGLHDPEDRLLRENLRLAWIAESGPHQAAEHYITLENQESAWVLVLHVGGERVARARVPDDRVWTIADLMQSAHVLGMVEQMKMLAQEAIRCRVKDQSHPSMSTNAADPPAARLDRSGKWATGMAALALAVSFVAASIALYSLNIGLSAHVNAAIAQPQADARGSDGAVSDMADIVAHMGGGVRVDGQTLGAAGMALLTEAAATTGFSLNNKGQMVVMFSDPLCPACQQFESWIAEDGYQTFSPLMVPIALQPGAREVAAAVICSQNQARDWGAAIAGTFPVAGSGICAEGLQAVDRNNEIFRSLGFTHTPTFVAMNGRFMVGAQIPQDMLQWATANGSASP